MGLRILDCLGNNRLEKEDGIAIRVILDALVESWGCLGGELEKGFGVS